MLNNVPYVWQTLLGSCICNKVDKILLRLQIKNINKYKYIKKYYFLYIISIININI